MNPPPTHDSRFALLELLYLTLTISIEWFLLNYFTWTTRLELLYLNYFTFYISLALRYFIACSWPCWWLVQVLVITWSRLDHDLLTCSQFVHNSFMTCSHLIHDLFTWLFHILFTISSWLVHNLFKSYSWLVYVLLTTCSFVFLKMQKLQFLIHLVAIIDN